MNLSLGNRDHRLHVQRVTGRKMLTAQDRCIQNASTCKVTGTVKAKKGIKGVKAAKKTRFYKWTKSKGRYSGSGWWQKIGEINE